MVEAVMFYTYFIIYTFLLTAFSTSVLKILYLVADGRL